MFEFWLTFYLCLFVCTCVYNINKLIKNWELRDNATSIFQGKGGGHVSFFPGLGQYRCFVKIRKIIHIESCFSSDIDFLLKLHRLCFFCELQTCFLHHFLQNNTILSSRLLETNYIIIMLIYYIFLWSIFFSIYSQQKLITTHGTIHAIVYAKFPGNSLSRATWVYNSKHREKFMM